MQKKDDLINKQERRIWSLSAIVIFTTIISMGVSAWLDDFMFTFIMFFASIMVAALNIKIYFKLIIISLTGVLLFFYLFDLLFTF